MSFGGKGLSESTVKRGLRELNPDLEFDRVINWGQWHPYASTRQGVWYCGRHICSMDRGIIPELKTWNVEEGIEEITPMQADAADNAFCVYVQVLPSDPGYNEAVLRADRNDDNYTRDPETQNIYRWTHFRFAKVRGRVVRVGWRHTFEALIAAGIPGVTRDSIGAAFGVDMNRYPQGEPEEVLAALTEE